jgi:hypothetical protein
VHFDDLHRQYKFFRVVHGTRFPKKQTPEGHYVFEPDAPGRHLHDEDHQSPAHLGRADDRRVLLRHPGLPARARGQRARAEGRQKTFVQRRKGYHVFGVREIPHESGYLANEHLKGKVPDWDQHREAWFTRPVAMEHLGTIASSAASNALDYMVRRPKLGKVDATPAAEEHHTISADAEINLAKEMQGLLATQDSYFDTARWMAGAEVARRPPTSARSCSSTTATSNWPRSPRTASGSPTRTCTRCAASSALARSRRPTPMPCRCPQDITPAHPDASETAEEVRRAFEAGTVHIAKLNGKHSGGTMIGKDPETHHLYLLKPGSGDNSPAAGVHEEDASQSRREAAFWHTADFLGLGEYMPRADLLYIDGREVAAIRMLPLTFKNLGTALKQNPSLMPHCMRPYLVSGILHKWAVMDYILGNPDRHSQNIMIDQDGRTLRLIDHGSAMAGRSFDPAHDENSFIPYYLRAWTGMKFNQLDEGQKLRQMPTAGIDGEKALARWLRDIDPQRLAAKLQSYGIDPEPMVERLEYLKMLPGLQGPGHQQAVVGRRGRAPPG